MEQHVLQRLERMEKKYNQLKILFMAFLGMVILGVTGLSFQHKETYDLIRTRGIVIEDSLGRDRILIGAPVPASRNRVRTDTSLVRKYWAKNYDNPDQFMKWYSDYQHSAVGIVVMNEEGFDRVLMGDKLADPNTGKRMFESSGFLWNDRHGWERGGAGVNTTKEGVSRTAIGLDDDNGEAVHLVALEDGTKGLIIGGENGQLMIGMSKENGQWFQNKNKFTGIRFFDKDGKLLWEQEMKKSDK